MILQKLFQYADLLLKKHFLLLSILKTVVLLNIFVKTVIFFKDSLINRNIKIIAGILFMQVFIITFDQFNASMLDKSINFFPKRKKILMTSNFWTVEYTI